jgi:hypothetical protein
MRFIWASVRQTTDLQARIFNPQQSAAAFSS